MTRAQLQAPERDLGAADILDQLTYYELLPVEALRAATNRRAEMVPLFIAEIDKFLAADFERDTTPTPLFFIFHLLGDWRETAAYRPLARLLHCNSDDIDAAIGDAITTTSHRVMAAVFDGDPQPLYDIVLDPAADEFVRAHMCQALVMLVIEGRLPREGVENFLRSCFTSLEPQGTSFVWDGWQQAIAALAMSDMALLVRQAFDNQFIDPQSTDFHYFEKDLRHALDHPDDPWAEYGGDYTLFGDTIEELSEWYGFSEQYEKDRKRRRTQSKLSAVSLDPGLPVVNPFRKVGRNEPCPCGSGKKFKKCCLQ